MESSPTYPVHWEADVVLRDGGTARIRPITPADGRRLIHFYERVSDQSKYYRFFAPYPRLSDRDVHRFTHHDYVDRVGLAATMGGEFIATVRYDRVGEDGGPGGPEADHAEVAFLVQDAHQGRGVASALLEHIAAVARERGIRHFDAEVLPDNAKMVKVFTDAGYTARRSFADGVVHLDLDLSPTEASVAVMRAREQRAEARSVQRLLAPRSIAVIGAGRDPSGVGRTLLGNILAAGFTGPVHAVNHHFAPGQDTLEPEGVPAHRSVGDIGAPVDLAVLAVPAAAVPDAVADCGTHGVQGLLVVAGGYAESGAEGRDRQRALIRQARSYGMRVIGPNAFGVLNTAPDVRLNATLAPQPPAPGRLGLFTQSGAIGIALLAGLRRAGGAPGAVSTFVSAGNRADLSGNDLLQYWHDDPRTDVALMYLESIGNPRKFTRLARRTSAVKPVVVVKGARHSGSLPPPGHTVAATRIPDATVSALFRQAGIIRVDTVTELLDTGLLLAHQPLPRGSRVGILGNSESLGLLAYDVCLAAGLRPAPPRDLTTKASAADFHAALTAALADHAVDAVVVTAIPRVGPADGVPPPDGDDPALADVLRAVAAGAAKPIVVTHLTLDALAHRLAAPRTGAPEPADRTTMPPTAAPSGVTAPPPTAPASAPAPAPGGFMPRPGSPPPPADGAASHPAPPPPAEPRTLGIPAYPSAERAVRALAHAVRYARWRKEAAMPGRVPELDGIDEAAARDDVDGLLDHGQGEDGGGLAAAGRTLGDEAARTLLGRYGITVRPAEPAPDADTAVRAAGRLGYPVALKATAPHLRHRADLGCVRLDLSGEAELRRAYAELTERHSRAADLLPVVQAMAPRGVDTVVRAVVDPAAGAVLSFGLAGAPAELLGDLAHRLVPVTDRDAGELVRSIKAAPMLFGWRGAEPVDTAALEELLLRVSRLVDDIPEVVAVALEPVVVARRGLAVLGATVRLAPPPVRGDLGPRALASL